MVKRRKLFSEPAKTRRKLFSEETTDAVKDSVAVEQMEEAKEEMGDKVLVCSDCRSVYRTPDGDYVDTTNYLCPKCGGNRFEVLRNLETPELRDPAEAEVVDDVMNQSFDKVFSNTRRKLFSDDPIKTVEVEDKEYDYYCMDCKTVIKSDSDTPTAVKCPSCGSSRVEVFTNGDDPQNPYVLDPAANPKEDGCCGQECEDNQACEMEFEQDRNYKIIDDLINEFRGKNVSSGELKDFVYEKYGIEDYDLDDLIEAGYIEEIDVNPEETDNPYQCLLRFKDTASLQNKIFSAVKISITKEFDLDPVMDHESVMETLGGRLPEEGMMILKRIHGHANPKVVNFSENFLVDSGISNDIKAEYGGQVLALKEFLEILDTRYPDAPDNIIDLLSSDGVIEVSGGQVKISE